MVIHFEKVFKILELATINKIKYLSNTNTKFVIWKKKLGVEKIKCPQNISSWFLILTLNKTP